MIEDFVSEVYRHKTAERIWVTEKARIIPADGKGEPCFYEGSVRDITPLIRERQIEERLEKLADNLPGGLFQLVRRADGTFYCPYVSNGFVELLGLAEPLAGLDPTDYLSKVHSPDLPAYVRSLQKSGREMSLWTCEFRYRVGNDVMLWLLVTATPEKLADGSVIWHGYVKDISERKAAEEHTHQLAYYDALTELPNRRLFTNRLEMSVRAAGRRREHGAVLFLDLDNFKMLNDAHGHEAGDCLLRQAAARLRDSVRACDTVGRFGGDEFVLLLDGLGSDRSVAEANVARATAKILAQFNKGFRLDGFRHVATPSIGVVIFDGDQPDRGTDHQRRRHRHVPGQAGRPQQLRHLQRDRPRRRAGAPSRQRLSLPAPPPRIRPAIAPPH